MRSLRWLLLAAMIVMTVAVFGIYRAQMSFRRAHQRPMPAAVPVGTRANAIDWQWGQSSQGKPVVEIIAKNFQQDANSNKAQLQGVELRIFMKDGLHYDRVKSPTAEFSTDDNKLYAPGEAEITLDVPVKGDAAHQLTSIKAAGINFDSKTGQAVTDKPVQFTFEDGTGTCTGATYDPQTHELHLLHGVVLNLRGKGPNSKPMKVETEVLEYHENEALVRLGPWSRMTRGETVLNAGASIVKLRDKRLQSIDAAQGKGTDTRPGRELEYAADAIHVDYTDTGAMEKMSGMGNARLVSHGNGSDTTMSGDNVDLFFNTENDESELTSAIARGKGLIESKPVNDPKGNTPDTKILKAELLDLHMKPGGKDLDRVNTHTPGTLEFVPNQRARHRRVLKASRMDVSYGARSEIQSFHAENAATETYPSEDDRKKKKPELAIAYTTSRAIDATFDEKGQLKRMKQTDNFHYSEGPRQAQADSATLENDRNVMNLDAHARISDATGSTTGDQIELQQSTGDFDARGHVSTTRLPDEKKASSDMLDKDEPSQGMADRVTSANRNHLIHYVGNAVLWQSSNRIQADRVDVDRDKKSLVADGHVISQFLDSGKDSGKDEKGKDNETAKSDDKKTKPAPAQPIFTIVKAQHMVYTDADRLAVYSGGADLWRPTLTVRANTLRAWLNDNKSDADSRINHAFGDGSVEIVQTSPLRKRIGGSDHAEYYSDEGKIILTGGEPQLTDSLRGNTRGDKLTYFTDDDRLLVDGAPHKQVKTHLHRGKS
jgi:lipopolysaccharide export system protein LptA